MKFLERFLKRKKIIKPSPLEDKERELIKKKYQSFRELLSSNNQVLELIADMEEKLSGDFPIEKYYIEQKFTAISELVKHIIDKLNELSGNAYLALYDKFKEIYSDIEKFLLHKSEIQPSKNIFHMDEIDKELIDKLGGKNAHLGEVRNRIHLPTPDGFAVSAYAYKKFMEHNMLFEKLNKALSGLQLDDIETINKKSLEIQNNIINGIIPEDIIQDIERAYFELCERTGRKVMVSVRSSALQEDREFSFAGQYSTFLNVSPDLLLQRYKEVIASLFSPKAIFYYKNKGLSENEMAMPVCILEMIDAKSAGVIYSRDPNSPDSNNIVIGAIRGLGRCIVEGIVTPETYLVEREPCLKIIEKIIKNQKSMLVCRFDGKLEEIPISEEFKSEPCLSDEQILTLAEYALKIEGHFNAPQDIEWAIDEQDRLYILQTRPLLIFTKAPAKRVPLLDGYKILLDKGAIACKGVGMGKAYIIRSEDDLKNFPEGAVLIAKHTSTKFVTAMNKASAIITDVGGTTGHMASLAREFQVPTILDTEKATEIIRDGQEVTVDAVNRIVYEGHIKELEEFTTKRKGPYKQTRMYRMLETVMKRINPLNLIDPQAPDFKPEFCQTFHDITRFAHEMAMHEMFKLTQVSYGELSGRELQTTLPLNIMLIDLDGGIKKFVERLSPEDVTSLPFRAFFSGLSSMRWPTSLPSSHSRPVEMVAYTAASQDIEKNKLGETSFAFITKEYMNFSIRLGYHLSTVEAYIGDNINENYIRFFFKGGGAAGDRRKRRARLISEILKKIDFNIRAIEDVVDAALYKYKKQSLETRLEILGRLTAYTKQLDMVLYNDAVTSMYIEEFVKKYIKNVEV